LKNQPIKNVRKINGLAAWSIGFAGDLLWIHFGEKIERFSEVTNTTKTIGEIGLHLQCPWRIRLRNKVFLGNYDIYHLENDEMNEKLNILNNLFLSAKKCKTTVRKNGEFLINLGNELELHVLPVSSDGEENWRILDNLLRIHHVY
jgi:hypothetical protein